MKTSHEDEWPTRADPTPSSLSVRQAHSAVEAAQLLPLSVLARLCPNDMPGRVRPCNVYLSHVIVALDGDSAVGFAAFKTTSGPIRVAHEFWIDLHARVGLAPVTEAVLKGLESAVGATGCRRLVVVLPQSTPLRGILEDSGYTVSLRGAELIWFEKSLVNDESPLESA